MSAFPLIVSKSVIALLCLIGISFTISCAQAHGPLRNQLAQDLDDSQGTLDTEKFREVEVSAKEILFKLDRCDTDDRKAFLESIRTFARETTRDDQITLNQVGNGCWFLAKSSRLTVSQLFNPFQSKMQVKFTPNASSQLSTQVVRVEPNFIIRLTPQPGDRPVEGPPNDDYFARGKLWGLSNPNKPGIDVDAIRAWQFSKGSEHIVVGVIDTGIDYDHPDLQANVWCAPRDFKIRLGTEEISCPKGSHGYNALGTDKERCNPLDGIRTSGHGTHVSGIIGAVGNNHVGVVGVNWTTKLLGLKYMESGGGTVANAARAIDFAIELRKFFKNDANIRVLNASWGYRASAISPSDSQLLRETIENAGKIEILFAASAGEDNNSDNDQVEHYPSGFDLPNLISVTAVDDKGALADYSNFGQKSVHLSAPGSGIYSTYSRNLGDNYYVSGGTSMAAPFVSGAAALILSVPRCSKLSASELKGAIIRGVGPTRTAFPTETRGILSVYQSIMRCP